MERGAEGKMWGKRKMRMATNKHWSYFLCQSSVGGGTIAGNIELLNTFLQ